MTRSTCRLLELYHRLFKKRNRRWPRIKITPTRICVGGYTGRGKVKMSANSEDVTTLLLEWRNGSQPAGDQLMGLVYSDLRRLAAHYMKGERAGHTLQPTALVHELYCRIFTSEKQLDWQNRAHFFAVAAQTLRRILVDHARSRGAEKRGGDQVRLSLTQANGWAETRDEDVLAIDEALQRLHAIDERAAQVVELRFSAVCRRMRSRKCSA